MLAEPASRAAPAPSNSVSTVRPSGVVRTRIGSSSDQRDGPIAMSNVSSRTSALSATAAYWPLARSAVPFPAVPVAENRAFPLSSRRAASVALSM